MESSISGKIATFGSEGIKGNQILDLGYWFGYPGSAGFSNLLLLTLVSAVLLISAVVFFFFGLRSPLIPPKKKFVTKVGWYLLSFAFMGFLLVVFRYFGVVVLSVRFAWVLFFALLGFILFLFVREYNQKLPLKQVQYESYLLKKRYFPKKKKK